MMYLILNKELYMFQIERFKKYFEIMIYKKYYMFQTEYILDTAACLFQICTMFKNEYIIKIINHTSEYNICIVKQNGMYLG